MIVVDVGCATHGDDESVRRLIHRFHPDILYGFDPHPDMVDIDTVIDGCRVVLERKAAWLRDGTVPFATRGLSSTVFPDADPSAFPVACFDFAAWLLTLDGDVVVKMDCEGAEFPLLGRMIGTGADTQLQLLIVEWHMQMPGAAAKKAALLKMLGCPVEEWEF